jgi:hypothetical protein
LKHHADLHVPDTFREELKGTRSRIELVATFLMSIAIVLSAYCAYEATRWSGVQALAYASANTARVESSKASSEAWQQLSYDASTLLNLTEADVLGETIVVSELSSHFIRKEFQPYVDEWMALQPLTNPAAPSTPFDLPNFVNEEQERSKVLEEEASKKIQEAQDANQNGDDYVLATVFFALVLFFAGISTKLDYVNLQRMVLIFAMIGLGIGFFRMFTLPFH